MKTFNIILIALLGALFLGCENQLEFDPNDNLPGEVALSSEANISSVLVGAYDEAGDSDYYGGYLQIMVDFLGTTTEARWRGTFRQPREAFNKAMFVENTIVRDIWTRTYQVINQANLVIDRLDLVTSSPEEQDRIEGEAKFLRALAYFDLVRNFALPYNFGTVNSQLGVPLRTVGITDYTVTQEIARSTVEQVYTLILSDAQSAYNLLPETNSFYADKYAAQALLARIYHQIGNYPLARAAANDVLLNSGHALAPDFDGAFNNDTDGIEDIFAFQVTSQTGSNQLINHYASEADGGRGGDATINDAYLNLFDDPNDVRRQFTYINPANNRRLTLKFTNQFGNIPTFRIAEMHLIRAESNFRLNTAIGLAPLVEINALRERSEAAPLMALTLDLIFRERQLELAFEGFLANDYKAFKRSIVVSPSRVIPFNDNSIVFPIPRTEIDTNPLMVQNAGYN
jgi:hypothetical protein